MKPFALSGACTSGVHCPTCRDREGGRAWRQSLGRVYALPVDAPDFACPHGREWGYVNPAPRPMRPPLPIVELTDDEVEAERLRLRSGGCCGQPSQENAL